MNIAILISDLDSVGGTETQTRQIAKLLSKRHNVVVFTRRRNKQRPVERRNGFVVRRLVYFDIPAVGFFVFLLHVFLELFRKRKNIDVLQCMMLRPNGIIGVLAERFMGIKSVVWSRGEYKYVADGFFSKITVGFVIKMSRNIIVQSNRLKDGILRAFPSVPAKKICVIPNGVSEKGALSEGNKILYVGRLIPVKGVKFLIDAVREVKQPTETLIIGDGCLRKELEEMAEGLNVRFVGEVRFEDMEKYMREGRILVLPSLSEGFPNVVLEAMSYGIPVIATRVGGIPDIVSNGKNGFLVRPGDCREIAKRIEILLKDRKLWSRMRKECVKTARQHSWKMLIKRLEALYEAM